VVSLSIEEPPTDAATGLGTTHTWRLERIRSVDDQPVIYMTTWLSADLFPNLSADELDGGSLHDWMRTLGHQPQGGPRQIQAVPADRVIANRLGCRHGEPVLLLQGVTQDSYGRGLEWFSAWHRPHTVFDIDASVNPSPPASTADLARARLLLEQAQELLAEADKRGT
jgi:GntR family transcriptional regulator